MDGHSRLASVDLNLLVALDALLQERSVTRAGERLSLTQPAMSGALSRLRQLFDDELLVRTGRTMRATPFAETLEASLREILAQVEQTVFSRAHFDPATDARTFTVLATDYTALVLMRPLLEQLAHDAPHVRVRVESARIGELASQLHRGEVDLAVLPAHLSEAGGLDSEELFTDRFVVVVSTDHPEVDDRLTLEQLAGLPYLSFRQGEVRSVVDLQLDERGLGRAADALFESFVLGALLLRGTRMVAFLQERLARELRTAAALRIVEPPVPLAPLVERLSWHPRATNDPAHRWLRERIATLARSLEPV
jgi:DNA-binding transcriptional LysR family regulator